MSVNLKTTGGVSLGLLSFGVPSTARAYSADTPESIIGYTLAIVFVVFIFVLCYYILKIKQQRLLDKIEKFKVKDPGFDTETFQAYVSAMYFKLMDAWMKRDLKPVETYLSPMVIGTFQAEVDKHIRSGTFAKMDELSLDKAWIQNIRVDDKFDIIDIWVGGKAKTYTVDRRGQCVSGSTNKFKSWDQKWTFIRPFGITTVKEGHSGQCPSCLSTVVAGSFECQDCHGVIPNDGFQWVLAVIGPMEQLPDNQVYFDFSQN